MTFEYFIGPVRTFYLRTFLIIFLPINQNMCFGCSKEPSHNNICFG